MKSLDYSSISYNLSKCVYACVQEKESEAEELFYQDTPMSQHLLGSLKCTKEKKKKSPISRPMFFQRFRQQLEIPGRRATCCLEIF